MTATRHTSSRLDTVTAECQGCNWTSTARNALGTAARHHDAHGHEVRVDVLRIITFGQPTRPEDHGQTTILDAPSRKRESA